MADRVRIDVYPAYGCRMAVASAPGVTTAKATLPFPVIVLDNSGSMGNYAKLLANDILPHALESVGYQAKDRVLLITFETTARIYHTTVDAMQKLPVHSMGGTNMAPAVTLLLSEFKKMKHNQDISLLAVSDGEIYDVPQTRRSAEELMDWIATSGFTKRRIISSKAVRFMSSDYANPDTRALCALLQLSTSNAVVAAENAQANLGLGPLTKQIIEVLRGQSKLGSRLTCTSGVFKAFPWTPDSEASYSMQLTEGDNYFWVPTGAILDETSLSLDTDSKARFNIVEHSINDISRGFYESLLKSNMETFINQIKLLKILDTSDAQAKVEKIKLYFEEFEGFMKTFGKEAAGDASDKGELQTTTLSFRVKEIRNRIKKATKSIFQAVLEVANDNRVSQLNSAQQAAYLRSMDVSKSSKTVAKRTLASVGELSFDTIARKEAKAIHENLGDLADVDDSSHEKSFYSFDTTLGGIRAIGDLVADGTINDMTCCSILEVLNIVGIPCKISIGDYPDASTYFVDEIHFGSFVSMSDAFVHQIQGGGETLLTPATSKPIINVIPVFEDIRIAKFYKKHAPRLLEYIASVGMRRVVADVPMTFGYSVLAGFWKMIQLIDTNRSEQHARILVGIGEALPTLVGKYFEFLSPSFDAASDATNANLVNISPSGVVGIIVPVLQRLQTAGGAEFRCKALPKIFRSVYMHEVWTNIRKLYRYAENQDEAADAILEKLLMLDIEKTRTAPTELFEPEPEAPIFCDSYTVNREYLAELVHRFEYLSGIRYLEPVLSILGQETSMREKIGTMQNTLQERPGLDTTLGLTVPVEAFNLHAISSALIDRAHASRTDDATGTSKIADAQDAAAQLKEYVRARHAERYAQDMRAKRAAEADELTADLVAQLTSTRDLHVFCSALQDGVARGDTRVRITNTSSDGFPALLENVLSGRAVLAPQKAWVLLLGRKPPGKGDPHVEGAEVWNNGNVLMFADLARFEECFVSSGAAKKWETAMKFYKERRRHVYREFPNRHGHDNSNPSYWALGFATLEEMRAAVSVQDFAKYQLEHQDCCGF
ncbi:hypothetical protein HDU82_008279 [Entophlyctis luteolus]|nr:hypothetical protein HDU82_008279 [Entophlyctis luteolus]